MTAGLRRWAAVGIRVLFIVAVIVGAVWGFWGYWPQIIEMVAGYSVGQLLGALAVGCIALLLILPVWLTLAGSLGIHWSLPAATRVLYIGQLGKYIPGGVWSVGAQMHLSSAHKVGARTSVGLGMLFIGVHFASALVVGSAVAVTGALPDPFLWPLAVVGLVIGIVALTPPVLRLVARLVAGKAPTSFTRLGSAAIAGAMLVSWAAWALSTWILIPQADWFLVAGGTSLAYAAGLVVPIAPAGLGVREAVFVALLTPEVGLAAAVAVSLASRLVTAIADFGFAGVAHVATRRGSNP